MFPGLFRQKGKGNGIVVGEVLDIVWSNRSSAKARGVLPGCKLAAASRIRVARALLSRHAITSSISAQSDRSHERLLDFGVLPFERHCLDRD